eukprot:2632506-Amphidinium_carterae.1
MQQEKCESDERVGSKEAIQSGLDDNIKSHDTDASKTSRATWEPAQSTINDWTMSWTMSCS